MNPHDENDLSGRFVEDWKEWAGAKTRLSPRAAAGQVLSRLERPQRNFSWLYPAVATGLICLSIGLTGLWFVSQYPVREPAWVSRQAAPLSEGEVLMWLDEKTPLYMNFQTLRESK